MAGMMRQEENFHRSWMERTIDYLEERKRSGERCVEIGIGELQRLHIENLSLQDRCDRLEKMLFHLSTYTYSLNPPALFGGATCTNDLPKTAVGATMGSKVGHGG